MSQAVMGGRAWLDAENKSVESRDDITSRLSHHWFQTRSGNVELLSVCDFCRKFASPGQPVRGVYQDLQICDKNHKFATGLARIYAF
jgi:hypothetical protein